MIPGMVRKRSKILFRIGIPFGNNFATIKIILPAMAEMQIPDGL